MDSGDYPLLRERLTKGGGCERAKHHALLESSTWVSLIEDVIRYVQVV
jgi:hypothetical protein